MDKRKHSEQNEKFSFASSDSQNSRDTKSLLDELEKSAAESELSVSNWRKNRSSASSSLPRPKIGSWLDSFSDPEFNFSSESSDSSRKSGKEERLSSNRNLNLPEPGKRLQSLMNHVQTVRTTGINPPQNRSKNTSSKDWADLTAAPESDSRSRTKSRNSSERRGSRNRKNECTWPDENSWNVPVSRENSYPRNEKEFRDFEDSSWENSQNADDLRMDEELRDLERENPYVSDLSVPHSTAFADEYEREKSAENASESEIMEPEAPAVPREMSERAKRFWKTSTLVLEISAGLTLGLGLILAWVNVQNPMDKRVFHELQQGAPARFVCDGAQSNFMNSTVTFSPMQVSALNGKNPTSDFSVLQTNVSLDFLSQIGRNLKINSVQMNGVEFPNLTVPEIQESWRPEPLAPLFTDEIQTILADRKQSLESIRYLEDVKEKHLPTYQVISQEIVQINGEMKGLQKKIVEGLGLTAWTPDLMDSPASLNLEFADDFAKIKKLQEQTKTLQGRWMALNERVSKDLAQIKEKIALDGQGFSTLLHFPWPTDESLGEYLFKTELEKRFAETLTWINAISCMAETGVLAQSSNQAENLKSNGTIELYGQSFDFDSTWKTSDEKDCAYAYQGNMKIYSDTLPQELMRDTFLVLACKKADSKMRTVTARIPLTNDAFIWGDYRALPLYGHAQNSAILVDLTIFENEVRGKITVEMNQVAFDAPDQKTLNAQKLYAQFADWSLPTVQIFAEVSGTVDAPIIQCSSPETANMVPVWCVALKEIHQTTRKDLIAYIYQQLKNAETAFNGTLEPYYRDYLLCSNSANLLGPADVSGNSKTAAGKLAGKAASKNGIVQIEPMNLAHLEVNQAGLMEDIPTYNPNMGILPVAAQVGGPVGAQAETPAGTIRKTIPVKKVAEIAPLTINDLPGSTPAAPAVPPASPTDIPPIPVNGSNAAESSNGTPNLADPVLYSKPAQKPLKPMDVPAAKKSSMPLPMMKSTSNFGS